MTNQTFNKESLAQYNGKNGQKAYVAVKGKVYDLTAIPQWKDGDHNGLEAGKDLTEAFAHSHHKKSQLANVPIVGSYVE